MILPVKKKLIWWRLIYCLQSQLKGKKSYSAYVWVSLIIFHNSFYRRQPVICFKCGAWDVLENMSIEAMF